MPFSQICYEKLAALGNCELLQLQFEMPDYPYSLEIPCCWGGHDWQEHAQHASSVSN